MASDDGYEYAMSAFGGTPLLHVKGIDAGVVRALAALGFSDADQVLGAAASSDDARKHLADALGLKEAQTGTLLNRLAAALPARAAAGITAPLPPVPMALGALQPTAETAGEATMMTMATMPEAVAALPAAVSYIKELPAVRSQGSRGTCVAFTLTAIHEFHASRWHGVPFDYSEQHLYHEIKLIDGQPVACGTWQVKGAQVLNTMGQCHEPTWPYNPLLPCNNNGVLPAGARPEAAANRMPTVAVAARDVNAIKATLAAGSLCGVSVPVWNSWHQNPEVQRTGRITMRLGNEPSAGGHAMCVVGYQDDAASPGGGFFLLRNSWGTAWAYDSPFGAGYGTIPYAYIARENWESIACPAVQRRVRRPWWQDRVRERIRPPWFGEAMTDAGGRPTIVIDTGGQYDIVIR